ncbi:Putative peptidase M20, xaa-Arg dipeptidase, bacterial exopeptidase dimerization [Septoria linicola]|uniref:Peptidase M20 domain-containing protein 2 n=1 Tax=Septoria linicola TaxID=215465 RepID=A0A9Q9EDA3_9PEZI|nr:putative peptidase M20, xaa-Arg dipeptidase, bacterial exopeptidase dimerization [Septoria linicola]USW47566.1 Putative peptidase M20, xaa-Arg dipeptidase, bacterial exopeptidase dimerization [Septoria linicola]
MEQQPGWHVTRSAYQIDTAFVAVFDSGRPGPVVSFNAEYDALKSIGHACGHNLIAIASIGAALATAELVREQALCGKVALFGTPAEEGGGGKIKLLKAGAYAEHGVDISLISHPGITPDSALMRTAAYSSFKVEYFGREAHAAARPWDGINALDALIIAYTSTSALRQQTQPGDIIQGQILNGGLRPNIIHAYASGLFVVRSENRDRLAALKTRVLACFEGAATATGAQLKITQKSEYEDHMPNRALGQSFREAFNQLGGDIPTGDIDWLTGTTMASTDQGDISHAMPSISPNFWIRSSSGGPHTPDFEKAARTEEAHALALRVAKCLAATAIDVVTKPVLLAEVKREFAAETGGRHSNK